MPPRFDFGVIAAVTISSNWTAQGSCYRATMSARRRIDVAAARPNTRMEPTARELTSTAPRLIRKRWADLNRQQKSISLWLQHGNSGLFSVRFRTSPEPHGTVVAPLECETRLENDCRVPDRQAEPRRSVRYVEGEELTVVLRDSLWRNSRKLMLRSFVVTSCLLAFVLPVKGQERADMPGPIAHAAVESARLAARGPTDIADGQQFPGDAAWSRARQLLSVVDDVRATLDDGASVRGPFRMADDESVTLWVARQDQQLMRARVRRLSVAHGTHRRRHVYVGLAIGAVAALVDVNRYCRRPRSLCQEDVIPHVYPWLGAGAAIGALLPAGTVWRDIYVRPQP
jgi:hypothetical protein